MDQVLETPKNNRFKKIVLAIAVIAMAAILYQFVKPNEGKSLNVKADSLMLSKVIEGQFDDAINIRANVEPLDTLYLDAIEGGRVEAVYVEDGQLVDKGQLIVELSNPTVQISVIRSDADTTQQLNNIRSLELNLEQNRLRHKQNLVDINYQITRLELKIRRFKELNSEDAINTSELEDALIEYEWYVNRREVTLESQKTDARMQEEQMAQLKKAGEQLARNLLMARKNLDNLSVKAPTSGRLTDFNLKVGQTVGVGSRIGQLDEPSKFKLTADIGEFYIGRVKPDQKVVISNQKKNYELHISKIYPNVQNNKFKVDIEFNGEIPENIRRGQTIAGSLLLGESNTSMLVDNGGFYQDTGGNWVFVVSEDGESAVKRAVKLGRRNAKYVEVLSGLKPGEFIVASSYASYKNKDRLSILAR